MKSTDMKVVGITTQQEVYVGSREKNFRINEFLIIEDKEQGDLIGEVIEARTLNRYIPLDKSGDFVDSTVLESLEALGYNIDEETIYISKIRLFNEALYPVITGSPLRVPTFKEVKDLMIKCPKEDGLVLGVIRNTDAMTSDMDEEYQDLVFTFEDGELKEQDEIPYIMDLRSMHQYPHIGVFGGSGSGKSFGLRVILEEIMMHNVPTIILDPHFEMDFSEVASYFDDLDINYENRFECLQVGRHIGVKFEDIGAGDLKNLLDSSSKLTDAMNNAVDVLFKPKDSLYSFTNRLTMLSESQELGSIEKIETRIRESENDEEKRAWKKRLEIYDKYDKSCPYSSVRGIMWRLKRLENEGVFSKDIKAIEEGIMNGKLLVIQGNTRLLQVFSTYLLNNLYHKRREYKDAVYRNISAEYFPPFIVVTDEAHNFAPKGYDSPSKSILKEISQEGRKYGVFLILATQRPTLLDETITAQLNTKFIFRTVRASDIQTIQEETDLTIEETSRLPYLRTGDVFISSAMMGRTTYARIRAANTSSPHTENPFDELKKFNSGSDEEFFNLIKDKLPVMSSDLMNLVLELEKEQNITYTLDNIETKLQDMVDKGYIDKEETFLGDKFINKD